MQTRAIHFTSMRCGLGWLLVAASARGVCVLRFGDDPEELARTLRAELPWAELREDAAPLEACASALRAYLEGRSRRLELPLDVRGSRFQRRVWDAIRAIPYGQTCSYGELAREIGRPGAARAVAGACAANRVALAIPCHRVVGSGGGTGGYRWGTQRKRWLLGLEQKESDKSLFSARLAAWPAPRASSQSRHAAAPPARVCSTPRSSA